MAKLEKTACPGFAKKADETYERWVERTQGLLQQMEDISSKKDPRSNPLKNALLRFPVADGYAFYVVTEDEPLTLQHVPFLDGYQADPATIRGVVRSTVRAQLQQAQLFRGFAGDKEAFYASLRIGSIVHYKHSYGAYVRCTVVAHPGGPSGRGLKPVAALGDWPEHDRPRRRPDGEAYIPPTARRVLDGEIFTPNEADVYECDRFPRKSENPDPSGLATVSLELPLLSQEQERSAALWRRIGEIKRLCSDASRDPQAILAEVAALASAP